MKKLSIFLLLTATYSICLGSLEESPLTRVSRMQDCIASKEVSAENSPMEIVASAKVCAELSDFDTAAELVMIASAYGHFDTLRVADTSAHNAIDTLFAFSLGSLPKHSRKQVLASIKALEINDIRKEPICAFLGNHIPNYMPYYMIAQGEDAYSDTEVEPLVNGFDPQQGWRQAMRFINCLASSA